MKLKEIALQEQVTRKISNISVIRMMKMIMKC